MERGAKNRADKGIEGSVRRKNLIGNLSRGAKECKQDGAAAFYIETFALLAVFTAVTVLLVNGFLLAGKLSREAGVLSGAVHLAENAAEMVAASDSGEMLFGLLNEAGNASVLEAAEGGLGNVYRAEYDSDTMPESGGIFYADVSWIPDQDGLVRSTIDVYWNNGAEPVYTLELAVYGKLE